MSEQSARLALPYLMPSQAQKHVTHNEALRRLDVLTQLVVEEIGLADPPALPGDGAIWVAGNSSTGGWAGHDGEIAQWADGAWLFVVPAPGWLAYSRSDGTLRVFDGAAWSAPEIAPDRLDRLGINAAADMANRLSVAAAATLLSHDGAGHQLKINKAAAGDTGSLLFQTGWSGRAEMGLAGDDDFSVKTSPDGSAWSTALRLRAADSVAELWEVEVSGGVHLGGTTPGNRLSAYESGSYSPSLLDASGHAVSLAPAEVRFVRVGDMVSVFFADLPALSTSGLVGTDAIAVSLPFAAEGAASCSADLQGSVGQAGPYHWQTQPGQARAGIRSLSADAALSVADISSGVTGVLGGTLTYCVA